MTQQSDTFEPWKMPPPLKVLDAIEEWRQMDLRAASDQDVRARLRSLLDTIEHVATTRVNTRGVQTVFRARFVRRGAETTPWPWTSKSDLLYPPRDVAPRQRCNEPGEPVLYCARDVITCIREMHATEGDQLVVATYRVRDASLAVVVPKDKTDAMDGRPIFDNDGVISFLIFREFVRSEFTKPVGKGTEFLYKLSNAICRVLFDGADNDGWLYPSVESASHECLAFKTSFVDSDRFELCEAARFDILAERDRCFVAQRSHKAVIHDRDVDWEPTPDSPRWITPKRRAGDPPLVWPLPGTAAS